MKPNAIMVRRNPSAASTSVSFVSAVGASFVSGATSINSPSSPAGIANSDGLFAIVFARSALTPPAGWTLVASKSNTGTLTQTLFVYRKDTVTTSDSSTAFTWSQAASGRMGLAYVVARSSSGTITVAANSTAETDYVASTAYPHNVTIPTLTATVDGELFLIAAASESATTNPSENTWSAAATGSSVRTTATQAENRLAAFTHSLNSTQSNSTPFTMGIGGQIASANYYTSITVRLQP